ASIFNGGSGTATVGYYVSYAYYNSMTGHTGECSVASNLSGPSSGPSHLLNVAVTAAAQAGVGRIGLFTSQDGGVTRYLLIDGTTGDPEIFPNTTGNIQVSIDAIFLNLNVEETAFNTPPPQAGFTYLSRWKNRIMATIGRSFQYSGFDQIA